MGIIFISYRREDSLTITGRIRDRLAAAFGTRNVYMDVRSIAGGQEFPRHIDNALQHADAQVVIIGPTWLDITDLRGNRRLDDPTDFVRHEIEMALQRGIGIVPVLVDGASMPSRDKLPESIRDLSLHQAITIGGKIEGELAFDNAIARLIWAVKKYTSERAHVLQMSLVTRTAACVAWMTFIVACVALLDTVATLLSVLSWPSPIAARIHQYPAISLLVSGLLLMAALSSLVNLRLARMSHESDEPDLSSGWHGPRTFISLGMSSFSTLLFFGLLSLVLLQPPWCRVALSAICPSPQLAPQGIHDSNLEIYLITQESGTLEISGDPQQYTLKNVPSQHIGAVRIDQANQGPYKVVVGVHSLQQDRYGLIIEQVIVVIDSVPPSPYPLNVWTPGSPLDYRTNPYLATYIGQPPGAALQAKYVTVPNGKVQLRGGETDQLDIQLESQVRTDLHFHVEVVYKTTTDPTQYTLVLPQQFEVVFSDASNWHQYNLQGDGRFAPMD